jgi:hypothetical protein
MPANPDKEEFHRLFEEWIQRQYTKYNLTLEMQKLYEAVNPTWMSPAGLQRYWKKFRVQEKN